MSLCASARYLMGKSDSGGDTPEQDEEGGIGDMAGKTSSNKVTSSKVATKASAALRDGRSSARTKAVAASALAQAKAKKK